MIVCAFALLIMPSSFARTCFAGEWFFVAWFDGFGLSILEASWLFCCLNAKIGSVFDIGLEELA